MSRIGNKHIDIPAGVEIQLDANTITVKGAKGTLTYTFNPDIIVEVEGNQINVKRPTDDKNHRALHGTTRALIHNMVVGVSEGFTKILEINGVGYRAQLQGDTLVVSAGYSHTVPMKLPEGIKVVCPTPTEIQITGCDKQVVGEFAAEIRAIRKPEPYKGKGIRYQGEYVRRKEGKKAK
ncbi:MAG: 50S ribosomal protein L6 [Prevotella sp.]|nr:50S ribosomal protein L6 [Staphylococcus sp.]MCM1350752.1 50S ribosomal protein L6 [Prevotella sp.]